MKDDEKPASKSGQPDPLRPKPLMTGSGAAYMGLGLQFGLSIVLFMFAGKWLDDRLGTEPWLMVAGVFLGATAAFYSMYRRLMNDQKRRTAEKSSGNR